MTPEELGYIKKQASSLAEAIDGLQKAAFTPTGMPQGSAMAPDPNAMPPGGAPPMDPAMAQQGAPPVDPATGQPMDPAMMQGAPPQGGMPPVDPATGQPMDPAMMQQGAPPPGGSTPEVDQAIGDLANNQQQMASTVQEQQAGIDQMSKRQLVLEQEVSELRKAVKEPSPYEGPSSQGAAPAPEAPMA